MKSYSSAVQLFNIRQINKFKRIEVYSICMFLFSLDYRKLCIVKRCLNNGNVCSQIILIKTLKNF